MRSSGDDPVIHRVTTLDLKVAAFAWPFALARRDDIDAHFAEKQREKPNLWNGRVLIARNASFAGERLEASYFETDFASFLAWRDWGFPDGAVFNGFGMGALRCADGDRELAFGRGKARGQRQSEQRCGQALKQLHGFLHNPVSWFRHSYPVAAGSFTNVRTKGTLANPLFSNVKSTTLAGKIEQHGRLEKVGTAVTPLRLSSHPNDYPEAPRRAEQG